MFNFGTRNVELLEWSTNGMYCSTKVMFNYWSFNYWNVQLLQCSTVGMLNYWNVQLLEY